MIEWFVSSAALLLVLIALHYLLRGRVSPKLQYGLWALALVRLLLPFSVGQSAASVENLVPETQHYVLYTADRGTARPAPSETGTVAAAQPQPQPGIRVVTEQAAREQARPGQNTAAFRLDRLLLPLWIAGTSGVLLWFFWCNLSFGRALRRDAQVLVPATKGCPAIYVSPSLASPCLFGFLRSAIYLTPEAAGDDALRRHCVAHEQTHYRHGDHLWALLRGLCLALHWFDPLAWWAAQLSRTDAELCCDEGAIAALGEDERAGYGRTLIQMTCRARISPLSAATTMSARGSQLKERIRTIAKRPKTAVPVLLAVLLLAVLAAGCTMTGAKQKVTTEQTNTAASDQAPRRAAIQTRLNAAAAETSPTAQALDGLTAYLLAHYDQLDARGLFADAAAWEITTADGHDFALIIRSAAQELLDAILYTEEFDIANDADYRCSMALSAAPVSSGIVDYVNSYDIMPDALFARYLTEHGADWQDSGIWDYNTTWSLQKSGEQILLSISGLPDGSTEMFSMDCNTLIVTHEDGGLAQQEAAIEAKLAEALAADIVQDDTNWFPMRELDEETQQTALAAYTEWLLDNYDALAANGALDDPIRWELLATENGDGRLVLQSDDTSALYYSYALYYDAETGHVDDFDVRLMSALKESNVQGAALAETARARFAAYFRGHYDALAPLGIFRYGSSWTLRLTDGDLFLDAEKADGGTEQFIFTPDTGFVHRSGEAADAPGALEAEWADFAAEWRLDYLPIFNEDLYPENNGVPDAVSEYLMWVYMTNKKFVDDQGFMEPDWVQSVVEAHFPIRRLSMDDLPKTWELRNGRYEPVATGVNPKPLVRLDALEANVSADRTVYTLGLTFFTTGGLIASDAEWRQLQSSILAGDLSGLQLSHIDTFRFYFEDGQPVFLEHRQLQPGTAEDYDPNTPLQTDEFILPHGLRFGMSYDEALELCGGTVVDAEPGKHFEYEGYHYLFYGKYGLTAAQLRSVADGSASDPVTPTIRGIRLGDSMESVFDKFPCTDRELKLRAIQTVYDDGAGHTADLEFVANSYYFLRLFTPEGYACSITFARADNTVKYIDLDAPTL